MDNKITLNNMDEIKAIDSLNHIAYLGATLHAAIGVFKVASESKELTFKPVISGNLDPREVTFDAVVRSAEAIIDDIDTAIDSAMDSEVPMGVEDDGIKTLAHSIFVITTLFSSFFIPDDDE